MALELSSLDIHFLVPELKQLEGGRVDRIIQDSRNLLCIQFYVKSNGKKSIVFSLPSVAYISESRHESPEKLQSFCAALRKRLSNAVLESVLQKGSERIVELRLRKEQNYILIAELFSKGNIILCSEDMEIISSISRLKEKKYAYPAEKPGFSSLSISSVKKVLENENSSVSKSLAVGIGIGGQYAREACISAGVNDKAKNASDEDAKKIFESIKEIMSRKPDPMVVRIGGFPKPVPFMLNIYKGCDFQKHSLFSSAIESACSELSEKKESPRAKEMKRLQRIIESQESRITELEKDADKEQAKGERIYEQYQKVSELLSALKKARETMSWNEIRKNLKKSSKVKEINEAKKEIKADI